MVLLLVKVLFFEITNYFIMSNYDLCHIMLTKTMNINEYLYTCT
jgi:hypothetical protein